MRERERERERAIKRDRDGVRESVDARLKKTEKKGKRVERAIERYLDGRGMRESR